MSVNEAPLDQKLEALERARAWSPRVISKFESLIRTGKDWSLFRISPLTFGQQESFTSVRNQG